MESQSHLLTHAELKRRGITRYDAEIIIANGLPLPDPIIPTLCTNHLQNSDACENVSENKNLRSSSVPVGNNRSKKSLSTPGTNILSGISSKDPSPDENIGVKPMKTQACSRVSPCAKGNRYPIKRRSPRKRYNNSTEIQGCADGTERIEIKEEMNSPDEDEVLQKLGLDCLLPNKSSPQHVASAVQNIKMELDVNDDGYEYTDAELRSHNLCDFLDRSPRLKRHRGRKRLKRVYSASSKSSNKPIESAASLPPLITPDASCPIPSKANKAFFSPSQQDDAKSRLCGTPVRQSPRLHSGSQRQAFADVHKELLSGRHRSKAAHLAQELNCLVAKASTFAQRLTDLMMESSVDAKGSSSSINSVCGDVASSRGSTDSSSHSYQDPPVLEPEPPIISPSGSRRSSLDSPDTFSGFFPPPSKVTLLSCGFSSSAAAPPRRSRSVEEEHLSLGRRREGMRQLFPSLSSSGAATNMLSPSSLINKSKPSRNSEEDGLSKSDGYQYRRKRGCSPDIYDKPPLLRRDHYDTDNINDSIVVAKKHQHCLDYKISSSQSSNIDSESVGQETNFKSNHQLDVKAREDLHPQKKLTSDVNEDTHNHYHVGEDIYLKQNLDVSVKRDCGTGTVRNEMEANIRRRGRGRGRKRRQPRLIFRMKKDPELKKLLRAESTHSPNLQFKWDDDSDCDLGSSPPYCHNFDRKIQNHSVEPSAADRDQVAGQSITCPDHTPDQDLVKSSQSQGSFKDIRPECGEATLTSTQGLVAASTSFSSMKPASTHKTSSFKKRVRKVRLKMIDTSLNFDLVSPPLSPHK